MRDLGGCGARRAEEVPAEWRGLSALGFWAGPLSVDARQVSCVEYRGLASRDVF
jgi:hypothetical protein